MTKPSKSSKRTSIKGVFSYKTSSRVGAGATAGKSSSTVLVFAREVDEESVEIQKLNINSVPSGPLETVSMEEFLTKFTPEPEYYTATVQPRMQALQDHVDRGETHRGQGESYSAQLEFQGALKVDEEHVRANFGLGLTFLSRGDTAKAENVFRRLVDLEAAFEPQHKHLFNEFGISLRKCGLYDQALEYYARAREFAKSEDDHLLLNIARAHYEQGDIPNCVDRLEEALRVNPDLDEGQKFLSYLQSRGYADDLITGGLGSMDEDEADDIIQQAALQYNTNMRM